MTETIIISSPLETNRKKELLLGYVLKHNNQFWAYDSTNSTYLSDMEFMEVFSNKEEANKFKRRHVLAGSIVELVSTQKIY